MLTLRLDDTRCLKVKKITKAVASGRRPMTGCDEMCSGCGPVTEQRGRCGLYHRGRLLDG